MREKPFYFFFEAFVAAAAATHRCKFLKRQIEWNIHATLNFKRKGRKRKRRERRPFFKFRKMKNEIKLTQICSEEAQPN